MESEKLSLVKRLQNNPNAQRLLMIITIIYVLSPIDIIPDTMPVVGWLDDVAIIVAELAQYLIFVKNKKAAFEATAKNSSSKENEENK